MAYDFDWQQQLIELVTVVMAMITAADSWAGHGSLIPQPRWATGDVPPGTSADRAGQL